MVAPSQITSNCFGLYFIHPPLIVWGGGGLLINIPHYEPFGVMAGFWPCFTHISHHESSINQPSITFFHHYSPSSSGYPFISIGFSWFTHLRICHHSSPFIIHYPLVGLWHRLAEFHQLHAHGGLGGAHLRFVRLPTRFGWSGDPVTP